MICESLNMLLPYETQGVWSWYFGSLAHNDSEHISHYISLSAHLLARLFSFPRQPWLPNDLNGLTRNTHPRESPALFDSTSRCCRGEFDPQPVRVALSFSIPTLKGTFQPATHAEQGGTIWASLRTRAPVYGRRAMLDPWFERPSAA